MHFSREAERLGAAGVMVVPPYYSSPTEDELFEHYQTSLMELQNGNVDLMGAITVKDAEAGPFLRHSAEHVMADAVKRLWPGTPIDAGRQDHSEKYQYDFRFPRTFTAEDLEKIEETMALGGRQILLQGGLHPDLGIEYYEELFRWMKTTFPIWVHGLSPAEVQHIARVSKLGLEDTLRRLMDAGLDSIPGGGAEILSDRVRRVVGIAKGSTADWLEVMEVAHGLGMKTTATMMFGHVETLEERVDHLLHLRQRGQDYGKPGRR